MRNVMSWPGDGVRVQGWGAVELAQFFLEAYERLKTHQYHGVAQLQVVVSVHDLRDVLGLSRGLRAAARRDCRHRGTSEW